MADLIDRQAALDCFHAWVDRHGDVHTPDEMPEYRAIEELPSAQPERKRGEWIPVEDDVPYGILVECSKCGTRIMINDALEHKYCSECGADMRGAEDD